MSASELPSSVRKALVSRAAILEQGAIRHRLVHVKSGDKKSGFMEIGDVYIRPVSGTQRQSIENWYHAHKEGSPETLTLAANLVLWGIVDANGSPLFVEADLPTIEAMEGRTLVALSDAVLVESGLSKAANEESEGNLESDQTADSISD